MIHFVVNPTARCGYGKKVWSQVIEPILCSEKLEYEAHFSENAGDIATICYDLYRKNHAVTYSCTKTSIPADGKTEPRKDTSEEPHEDTQTAINDEISANTLTVIIVGGDGSLNEAIRLIPDFNNIVLGYIPSGSGNDLARDLKIKRNPGKALYHLLHQPTIRTMDLAFLEYEDHQVRPFLISCGIGFDAAVCEKLSSSRIKEALNRVKLGKLAYLATALKELVTAKRSEAKLVLSDDTTVIIPKLLFLTGMIHAYEGGGFRFTPQAIDDDGFLDVCAVGNIPKAIALLILPLAFFGKHYVSKHIRHYRAKEIHVSTKDALWVHTDGEVTRKSTSFHVRCMKQWLTLRY
ncbi:MAG: diacylglycerol kinase family lipid kinase [Clostridium sp.]|nr:diacylglycerol kinase family lipid kinase [Clostridium sp.]